MDRAVLDFMEEAENGPGTTRTRVHQAREVTAKSKAKIKPKPQPKPKPKPKQLSFKAVGLQVTAEGEDAHIIVATEGEPLQIGTTLTELNKLRKAVRKLNREIQAKAAAEGAAGG